MGKYWTIYKMKVQATFMYRGMVVIHRLGTVIMLVTLIAVWLASKSHGSIAGYTKDGLVTYYVLGSLINALVFWWCSTNISEEIRSGDIGPKFLLKPISYYWEKFFEEFGWHTVSPIIGLITTLIVAVFVQAHIQVNFSVPSLIMLATSISLGAVLFFNMSACIGLLTFWFTETTSIAGTIWAGSFLLGGQGVPISFFSGWARTTINFLPFRYIYSFPIEIYLNTLNQKDIILAFGTQIGWILILGLTYKILWHYGTLRYSAFGG